MSDYNTDSDEDPLIDPTVFQDVESAKDPKSLNGILYEVYWDVWDHKDTQPIEWPADVEKTKERRDEEQKEQQLLFEAFKKVSLIVLAEKKEIHRDDFVEKVVEEFLLLVKLE